MEASALTAPVRSHRLTPVPLLRLRSDDQLVALFRGGDEAAFQTIYDRYRQRIFSYTRQMLSGSRSDAEDAMQDVFLRAYDALRANDRPILLRAWLYRVAHNRCIDQLRRPTPPPRDVFEVGRAPLRDPVAEAERRADLEQLVADMRDLPEQQRSALLMRELDGLSYSQLAAALDVTVPAVKSLLVRARMGLVEAIEARGADCDLIREDVALAHGKGVRMSGRARRHIRECHACRGYRVSLRGLDTNLAALNPTSFVGGLLKLLGLGGAGTGALTAGGGTAIGGGAVAATGSKVVAVACCAAVMAGGAHEAERLVSKRHSAPAAERRAEPAGRAAPAAAIAAVTEPAPATTRRKSSAETRARATSSQAAKPIVSETDTETLHRATGGYAAPPELADPTTATETVPSATTPGEHQAGTLTTVTPPSTP